MNADTNADRSVWMKIDQPKRRVLQLPVLRQVRIQVATTVRDVVWDSINGEVWGAIRNRIALQVITMALKDR